MGNIIINGLARLAYQYRDSVKFQGFLSSFLAEFEELETSRLQLLNDRWLSTAAGVQLDGIGEIVGIERKRIPIAAIDLFGFLDDPTSLGFGDDTDPDQGGFFFDINNQVTVWQPDDSYLLSIRGRIAQNHTAMTAEDTIDILSFMVGGAQIRYYLIGAMYPAYEIFKDLTAAEEEAIKGLDIMLGIGAPVYVVGSQDGTFGFLNDDSALGFGSDTDATQGGHFAKIII